MAMILPHKTLLISFLVIIFFFVINQSNPILKQIFENRFDDVANFRVLYLNKDGVTYLTSLL